MTPLLCWALTYIDRGFSIIPLIPGTKRPAIELGPFLSGKRRLEKNDPLLDGFWGEGASCGIGIVTGAPSGIVVVDVDPRNGGNDAIVGGRLPKTTWVRTGGGGTHFYLRHPGGHVPCGAIEQGVDRKGDGGYVVAGPSIHPSGASYEVVLEGVLADMPDWVSKSAVDARISSGDAPSEPWVAEVLGNPRGCLPGTQEETLSRLCWWAAGHLPEDIARVVLSSWLSDLPLGNPFDPWTQDHLDEKLDRAYEKRPLDPGCAGPVVDDTPEPDFSAYFQPVSELVFPDQEWIVEDFAAPGAFTEIIGKVKRGKSTLTYQLIDAVRRGAPFLGRATVKGPVVLLTEQVGTSLKKTLERAKMLDAHDVYVLRKDGLKTLGGWTKGCRAATALCKKVGAQLLVVDTLGRLANIGGDAENKSDAVKVLDALGDARAAGVACIFVRHARKGVAGEADELADAGRGSSAITGDMDIVLRLTTATEEDDLRRLSWESRLTDDPEDVYLQYEDGIYVVVDKPDGRRERQTKEDLAALRAAIAELGTTGRNALATHLKWGNGKTSRLLKLNETWTHGPDARPVVED